MLSLTVQRSASALPCTPQFPLQQGVANGWLGGDVATSVPWHRGQTVWLFGDTLVGRQRTVVAGEPRMVHNTLGIGDCSPRHGWKLRYLIRKAPDGTPVAFFTPQDPQHWYWAMSAVRVHQQLVVALLCLRKPATPQPGAFNFEACGVDLATLQLQRDLLTAPVTIQPLLPPAAGISSVATLTRKGRYLFLYVVRGHEKDLVTLRLLASSFEGSPPSLETLNKSGRWLPGFTAQQARAVLPMAPSEMSIHYEAPWHRWLAIYKDPALLADKVLLRSAPSAVGPWSEPVRLFSIRGLDPAANHPGVFCYAAKDHPELAEAGQLLVTYVCNASDPRGLVGHDDLYRPRAVSVRLSLKFQVLGVKAATPVQTP